MKISQLIDSLKAAQEKYGDLPVCFPDFAEGGHVNAGQASPCYPWKAGQMGVEDKDVAPHFIEILQD